MVCRSMLASERGEMDRARLRLSLGVSRGLGNRDTAESGGDRPRYVVQVDPTGLGPHKPTAAR